MINVFIFVKKNSTCIRKSIKYFEEIPINFSFFLGLRLRQLRSLPVIMRDGTIDLNTWACGKDLSLKSGCGHLYGSYSDTGRCWSSEVNKESEIVTLYNISNLFYVSLKCISLTTSFKNQFI